MARKPEAESDTALLDAPPAQEKPQLTMHEARERFINRCLHDYALGEFIAQRGCDPSPVLVEGLIKRAGRIFDALFEKRPVTNNL